MENHGKSPFLIGRPSINGSFSMAMLNNQRVDLSISFFPTPAPPFAQGLVELRIVAGRHDAPPEVLQFVVFHLNSGKGA
jgi:hypothetical protein